MSNLKPYPKYKQSGVEWLGDVPEHWKILPMKRMAKICNGKDYKCVKNENGDYPVFGSGGEFAKADAYIFEGESVLLGRKGTIDEPLHVKGRFWTVDTMFYTKIDKNTNGRFLYFSALTMPFSLYSSNTALPSMTQETLAANTFSTPEKDEQSAIATFLDRETGRIDALVEEKTRFIELLKEKRQALITQTVTKGLDPNVKMKDSGVEWIGDVPEHWETKKISHWFHSYGSGTTPSTENDYSESGIPWVTTSELRENTIKSTKKCVTQKTISSYSALKVHPVGSLVIAMYGATVGRIGNLGVPATLNQACFAIHPNERISLDVLTYWFQGFRNELITLATGAGQPNINCDKIKSLLFSAPSGSAEQSTIATYLDRETKKIDALMDETNKSIKLLKEKRQALITAAVTGKIDVRETK